MLICTGAASLRCLNIKVMLSGILSIVETDVALLKAVFPLSIECKGNWQ
ncbi:hypothetical protein SOVF_135590 [Spinacia oleracea]|nr:hypothetical protein SOVF_135590 [Spinacia oleracea]